LFFQLCVQKLFVSYLKLIGQMEGIVLDDNPHLALVIDTRSFVQGWNLGNPLWEISVSCLRTIGRINNYVLLVRPTFYRYIVPVFNIKYTCWLMYYSENSALKRFVVNKRLSHLFKMFSIF